MKLLLDIADHQAAGFVELIKNYKYVTAKHISAPDAELFEEIQEIKSALKNAELVKSGKLKTRPIEDLLNEL